VDAPPRYKLLIAWQGRNEAARKFDATAKLYVTTWENPHPGKRAVRIDYVAAAPDTGAAPFCVAITALDK
jgi:hypothetical protein